MEQTKIQAPEKTTEENINSIIDNWKMCDVNSLAKHFHRLSTQTPMQHDRAQFLTLDKTDIDYLFVDMTLESFRIELGCKNEKFVPIITTVYPQKKLAANSSEKDERLREFKYPFRNKSLKDEIISNQHKEYLTRNWMELDTSLIDDVFTTQISSDEKYNQPRRLHAYHFTNTINKNLFKLMHFYVSNKISKIFEISIMKFHLGVDKNKSYLANEFAFSPIIEIFIKANKENSDLLLKRIYEYGLKSELISSSKDKNDEDGVVVYYEYSTPCPPSCP